MKAGEYVWDDQLTWAFLKLYRDNLDKFRNPQIRNKEIYIKLCDELLEKYPKEPLTPQLLTKKFFNLKRTHEKILIKKCSTENYDVSWKFFETMTKLLSSSSSNECVIDPTNKSETSFKFEYAWKDNVTYEFLDLYLDRIDEFKNPKIRNKNIFNNIAASLKLSFPDLPLTAGIVQKKFYNMKRTYLDIVQKKSTNKKYPINWKFFNKVHAIMSLTEQIKVEYVTYDFESKELSYVEPEYDEPSPKKFKKEYVTTTDMEDINFDEYVEYENVEYEVEETQDPPNKSSDAISKFDLDMNQLEEIEEDEDDMENENNLEEEEFEPEPELDTGEIIDLQMVDDDEDEEEDKQNESANEDQQHSSPSPNDVFTITESNDKAENEVPTSTSSKNELTPFMKAKLDIEAKKVALLEKIYNIQTERTDIDRDTLRVQKENNELLRKLLKVMTANSMKK